MLNVKKMLTKLAEIPNNLFITKTYTATKVISGSWGYITANEFGASALTGYTPIATVNFSQDKPGCTIRGISASAVGDQGLLWINNNGSDNSVNARVTILYVKTILL